MDRLTLHGPIGSFASVACALVACGAPSAVATLPSRPTSGVPTGASAVASPGSPASPGSTGPTATRGDPNAPPHEVARNSIDPAALYARLEPGLVRCYEAGKKATPEMTDGKVTLHASIDGAGKPTCVIPSDHTGLTQDVEDCMTTCFAAETFEAGAPWSATLAIVLRAAKLRRGEPAAADPPVIDSVETVRMPDAFDVLEGLEPALQACLRRSDGDAARVGGGGAVRGMLVGARVGADGRPQCALASSTGPLPAGVGECAAGVLRAAKFPPPRRGSGIVLVPINVVGNSSSH
jgi:hypothetical protein